MDFMIIGLENQGCIRVAYNRDNLRFLLRTVMSFWFP
jgi:hypothetical protein